MSEPKAQDETEQFIEGFIEDHPNMPEDDARLLALDELENKDFRWREVI